jgi:hypothetical protein
MLSLFFSIEHYLTMSVSQALLHAREAVRVDPDHSEGAQLIRHVKRVMNEMKEADEALAGRDFEKAVVLFAQVIETAKPPPHSPIVAQLHSKRAQCYLRLHQFELCLQDTAKALYAQVRLNSLFDRTLAK